MVTTNWDNIPAPARKAIIAAATVEGALKVAALIDLVRRPAPQVRGSKLGWAAAIIVVNSVGVVPATYFLRGRRKQA